MYCRGHQLREELCKQYDIKPVGHFKLLNGRTVVSDAGNMDITSLIAFQKQIKRIMNLFIVEDM